MTAKRAPLSLKARAVALLAQRDHSAAELRRKLLRIARDRDLTAASIEAADAPGLSSPAGARRSARASAPLDADIEGVVGNEIGADEADDGDRQAAREVEVDEAMAWLSDKGYLDEARFVESRIHARSKRWGQRRIEQELAQHGLAMDADQRATLSEGELGRACDMLARKFAKAMALGSDPSLEAKQLRFLLSRGFNVDVARRAVKTLPDHLADSEQADGG